MLFKRGKAISGAPIINGTNQLPNPPIIVGITKKKSLLKRELLQSHYTTGYYLRVFVLPANTNSIRNNTMPVPITPDTPPKMK